VRPKPSPNTMMAVRAGEEGPREAAHPQRGERQRQIRRSAGSGGEGWARDSGEHPSCGIAIRQMPAPPSSCHHDRRTRLHAPLPSARIFSNDEKRRQHFYLVEVLSTMKIHTIRTHVPTPTQPQGCGPNAYPVRIQRPLPRGSRPHAYVAQQ